MKIKPGKTLKIKILFSIFLIFFCIIPLHSDERDRAQDLEKSGAHKEAWEMYVRWLSRSDSAGKEGYGRTVFHSLRLSSSLKDAQTIVKRFADRIPADDADKEAVLKTAYLLSELSGRKDRTISLQEAADDTVLLRLFLRAEDSPADPLKAGETFDSQRARDLCLDFLGSHSGGEELLSWLDRCHKQYPDFLNHSDWLFHVHTALFKHDYKRKAEIFRTRLLEAHPDTVEADLLNGEIQLMPHPDQFISQEIAAEADSVSNETVYIQLGAFSDEENARELQNRLKAAGELSVIRPVGGIYKLILISGNEEKSRSVMDAMGIEGFRIPRLP